MGPAGLAVKAKGADHAVIGLHVHLLGGNLLRVKRGVFVDGCHVLIFSEFLVNLSTVSFGNPDRLISKIQLLSNFGKQVHDRAAARNKNLDVLLIAC